MTAPQPGNVFGTRFERILDPIEKQLQLELAKARAETDHNLTVGERVEAEFRRTLGKFLPSGFGVGHGKIYDAYGDSSRQTDVIITSPEHPFTFPDDQAGWYLVEGVAAVAEVKSVLTTAELADSAAKGAEFKKLRVTTTDDDAAIIGSNHWNYLTQCAALPPFILIAFENQVNTDTLRARLSAFPPVDPLPEKCVLPMQFGLNPQPPIDAVCILGSGVCLNFRPDDMLQSSNSDTGEPVTGWFWIGTKAPLAMMIGWIHQMMMPRFRGTSVLSQYVFPSAAHNSYMQGRSGFDPNDVDG